MVPNLSDLKQYGLEEPMLLDRKALERAYYLRPQFKDQNLTEKEILAVIYNMDKREEEYISRIDKKLQSFIGELELFRYFYVSQTDPNLSKARTIAETINNILVGPYLEVALKMVDFGDDKQFIAIYDYILGISYVVANISSAVLQIEGSEKDRETTQRAIRDALLDRISQNEFPKEEFDSMFSLHQKEYEFSALMFKKDLTGFALASQIVKDIQKEIEDPAQVVYHRIEDYQLPALIFCGAKFGQTMYEKLYNLWKPLPLPGQKDKNI